MKYRLGFRGKAGWQFWSGRAWTANSGRAATMTGAEVEKFFQDHPNINRDKIQKLPVDN